MDRYSAWPGSAGRPRRVPPRVAPQRRGATRAATWVGGRRWFIAFGTLALALLLPRLLAGQGLHSPATGIALRVTAPGSGGGGGEWRGAAVADVPLALPQPAWEVRHIELQLAEATPGPATLHARGADGRFAPVATPWRAIGATHGVTLRIVSGGGGPLAPGAWRVRYRLVPLDATHAAYEGTTEVHLPASR